jgi:hypothetical protein
MKLKHVSRFFNIYGMYLLFLIVYRARAYQAGCIVVFQQPFARSGSSFFAFKVFKSETTRLVVVIHTIP